MGSEGEGIVLPGELLRHPRPGPGPQHAKMEVVFVKAHGGASSSCSRASAFRGSPAAVCALSRQLQALVVARLLKLIAVCISTIPHPVADVEIYDTCWPAALLHLVVSLYVKQLDNQFLPSHTLSTIHLLALVWWSLMGSLSVGLAAEKVIASSALGDGSCGNRLQELQAVPEYCSGRCSRKEPCKLPQVLALHMMESGGQPANVVAEDSSSSAAEVFDCREWATGAELAMALAASAGDL